jgi:hypothetical protein
VSLAPDPSAAVGAPAAVPTRAGAGDEDIDPRTVADAARRVAQDRPSVAHVTIHTLIVEHLSTTRGAKVRTFRLLLAERHTRRHLTLTDGRTDEA